MAYGKIVADQIQHSSEGTVGTQYVVSGSAKAWVNANNDATTNSSFNISTGTDHATGQFSYTLTNSFTATNDFAQVAVMGGTGGGWSVSRFHTYHAANKLAVRVANGTSSHADGDAPHNVIATGALA